MLIEGVSASVDQQLTMGFCANSATSSPSALDLLFVEYASNGSHIGAKGHYRKYLR